ncbi:hypothetical protein GCM10009104_01600 [Marinobacterium maritimum]|uniref:HTH luxR-type domain-containing protein n=1 Tax=Marinobacterium maritimum TaxID=500162 RepID=A0ABN1I1A0_9GAMM
MLLVHAPGIFITGPALLQTQLGITASAAEVLYWIANGKTNQEIGKILGMSPRTVNKHLEQVYPALGVENRTAAAGVALRIMVRERSCPEESV